MGSHVPVVVAEIVMQNFEEQALATYRRTIPLWITLRWRHFTTAYKDEINDCHEHLNRQNADIQFAKEIEENDEIFFLVYLVTRDNLQKTDTYRQITRPVIVQPNLLQSYNYTDFDETSAISLLLAWQPTRRDWLPKQRFL